MIVDSAARLKHLRTRASELGLRMTPQRQVLLRLLSQTRTHPTADELFRKVRRQLPSVSHATVYRNLQELVRAGLIATLNHSGGPVQFDANPDDHHHFVCTRCGRVTDIYLKNVAYGIDSKRCATAPGRIDRAELQLQGLCVACAHRAPQRLRERHASRTGSRVSLQLKIRR
jgi:Fur family peroxide stress response transcriptional regulator